MIYLLWGIIFILTVVIAILLVKIASIHRAAEEIRSEFGARLSEDTNVGIDITFCDAGMRRLASDIDKQLKLLRKANIRYAKGDRELKETIANLSHDLRTPLTAVSGYLDLLEREDTSDSVKRYLQIIGDRICVLKQLTEELFRYSMAVSSDRYESRESVSLNEAVEESVASFHAVLKEKGITPEILITETRIDRRLNKMALARVLANIISNALKYSDGDLKILLSENGTITFTNHAKMLDEVTVGRLFDRFYTVENGQSGTGLGLSIAKALTERMGGSITASKKKDVFAVKIQFP